MGRQIRIKPYYGLGNRMLQYMLAEAIRLHLSNAAISGPGLEEWGIPATTDATQQAFALVLRGHCIPLAQTLAFAGTLTDLDIYLSSISARLCHYRALHQHYRTMFPPHATSPSAGADQLVINIRLAEIIDGRHGNYFPLPIRWYQELVEQTGQHPLFMGQLGDDRYSAALRQAFPQATFMASLGPREDFDFLTRAQHIVLPISTFSWLAGWLSSTAQTIHLPVAGLFHPGGRPDHDLLPLGDPRYHFHHSERTLWRGTASELDALVTGPSGFSPITHDALQARYPLLGSEGLTASTRSFRQIDPLTHAL